MKFCFSKPHQPASRTRHRWRWRRTHQNFLVRLSVCPPREFLRMIHRALFENPGDPEKGERSSLFRVLARTPFNSSVRACKNLCGLSLLRAPPPRYGRLQARRRTERLPTISPVLHLPSTCARGPFAARLDARALRRSCARTPKSGQLEPVQRPTDGAECARVLCRWCGGEGADAARRRAPPPHAPPPQAPPTRARAVVASTAPSMPPPAVSSARRLERAVAASALSPRAPPPAVSSAENRS